MHGRSICRVVAARASVAEEIKFAEDKAENASPERLYEGKERLERINIAMAQLTPIQRELIVRSRLKGETYAEISAGIGWSIAAISRQLNAALDQQAATCNGAAVVSKSTAPSKLHDAIPSEKRPRHDREKPASGCCLFIQTC